MSRNRISAIPQSTTCILSLATVWAIACQSPSALAQPTTGNEVSDRAGQEFDSISFMSWNIWHGGKEDGEAIGPERVVDVIRQSKTDVVAMQETYGSGELISKALGFHFHPRGTNVSIHSRFPVVEDISVFEEFKCVGGLLELPNGRQLAFYSIWLPYNNEIWEAGTRNTSKPESMLAACQASCDDLKKIQAQIKERLSTDKYADVPIVIAGDFNSMSHLDYLPSSKAEYKVAIDWPTSQVMTRAGFRDSWREMHPEVDRKTDRTWTPRFQEQEQDRIDFVYYHGNELIPFESKVIDSHSDKFPSDHAALVTRFKWDPPNSNATRLRVASYNIKHGEGSDNKVDLSRSAALLNNFHADIIGLQEVDNLARRSGKIDQAASLGKQLNMESAFGSFMDYDGGRYGMAILSRFPIKKQYDIPLPEGLEPRIALACEIELPNKEVIVAVNVHFDYAKNDKVRFEQARHLASVLKKLEFPYVLLGDFNDTPKSKTLRRLSANSLEAEKPKSDQFTFSSTDPRKEIDFIFAAPANRWKNLQCLVFDGPKTSDHRPVLAVFELENRYNE